MKTSWQVATAAEAFAAAQFARCGWDVSVQYGANQPEYDLVAVAGDCFLKISVKGSQNGKWGLTQKYLKKADYQGAIDQWLAKHSSKTVFCLVQLWNINSLELPRMYLATPTQIAAHLKSCAAGRGVTTLYEERVFGPKAKAAGTTDRIPDAWRFTEQRIDEIRKTTEA